MRTHPRGPLGALLAAMALLMLVAAAPAAALINPNQLLDTDVAAEPSAQLTRAERNQLDTAARRLAAQGTPTKFIVLGRAPGTVEEQRQYASLVRSTVGQQYSVLVLSASPRRLTFATPLPQSETTAIFNARVPELRADPVNGTVLVAQDIGRAVATTEPEPQVTQDTGSGGDSGGGSILPLLVIAGVGAGGIFWLTRRGRKKARRRVEDQDPMIDGLAAQINDLDPEIQVGGERAQAAKADYQDAVLTYSDARAAAEKAQTPAQIAEARAMLEKGLRSARRARAQLDGRPVEEAEQEPLLEGLCTFDPKHGRAVGQATVTAPDGRTAEVPVCADCMRRMEHGEAPEIREIEIAGHRRPYWQSGGGGMGGLMNGALLGILLGGMFGGGSASGDMGQQDQGGGWPDQWSGGGDAGGGGFGGGDFGGGGGDAGGGGF